MSYTFYSINRLYIYFYLLLTTAEMICIESISLTYIDLFNYYLEKFIL